MAEGGHTHTLRSCSKRWECTHALPCRMVQASSCETQPAPDRPITVGTSVGETCEWDMARIGYHDYKENHGTFYMYNLGFGDSLVMFFTDSILPWDSSPFLGFGDLRCSIIVGRKVSKSPKSHKSISRSKCCQSMNHPIREIGVFQWDGISREMTSNQRRPQKMTSFFLQRIVHYFRQDISHYWITGKRVSDRTDHCCSYNKGWYVWSWGL